MRFLLDMGLSPGTAVHLRSLGHDVVHLRDEGLQKLPDPEIFLKATDEHRILATFDLDFTRLIALSRSAWPSLIVFRIEKATTGTINSILEDVIAQFAPRLDEGCIVVVEPDRMRCRSLPIL